MIAGLLEKIQSWRGRKPQKPAKWSRYDTLRQVFERDVPTKHHILEVGTYNGNTAISLIKIALRSEAKDAVHYYGFDLWEDLDDATFKKEISKRPVKTMEEIRSLIAKESGLPKQQIHLFRGFTKTTLWRELPHLPKMDFIFIDGGHSTETVANDWSACEKMLAKSTVVIFDDYFHFPVGPKVVVDGLDKSRYHIDLLEPTEMFQDRFGISPDGQLRICLAKVTLA